MDLWGVVAGLITPHNLWLVTLGTLGGIIVGMLPGMTVTMTVGLLIGLTVGMPVQEALIILTCVFVGGIYGGSQSAILINVPGTAAAAATAVEGHLMCRNGQAGQAIGLATISSVIGTVFGALVLLAVAPLIAEFALKFASWEYFLLAAVGMSLSAALSGRSMALGMIGAFLGVLVAMVGMEEMWGYPRFVYGNTNFMAGFAFIPAIIGLFGLGEVLHVLSLKSGKVLTQRVSGLLTRAELYWRYRWAILRANIIGVLVGALPGVGTDIAAWVSFGANKELSRERDQYGKGAPEGVISAETANSAGVAGTFVPLLTLGIPGDAVTAVLLGGMMLHGMRPGPMMYALTPQYFTFFPVVMILSAFAVLVLGLLLAKVTPRILSMPAWVVYPIVVLLAIVGSFAVNHRVFDVWVMFGFGLLGWGMRAVRIPVPPMVIGLILGPMADAEFRRAMTASHGSLEPFFTRPISLMLIVALLLTILASTGLLQKLVQYVKQRRNQPAR